MVPADESEPRGNGVPVSDTVALPARPGARRCHASAPANGEPSVSDTTAIEVAPDGPRATVTLDRPAALNAITERMLHELGTPSPS